ncbi:histidinol-phosphate phosphatase family protein [Halobacteroides halobius DSM 5150]|uniref:D,D-heptose 1,7-bisphosphate phosphatase n=1 Tax=Halobacteroides halobius (strain ATCC 35273 / DSM 5150 / MD-1) TaxID=748449 RepID=L0KAX4_HALHC|nr:HAD family hydrolase [Halobacteroides halobius]AGB42166.1 histidinol-phosphate phosphatase family protein [Halobacteroides halobius DSM 5150]
MDLNCVGVFMDRDGTVSKEIGYVNHASRYELLPRTSLAIKKLNQAGIKALLATNQAGVARGYFKEEMIGEVHAKLERLLAQEDAYLDEIYYCHHHPDVGEGKFNKNCNCRKPKPGMLLQGAEEFDLDLNKSYMVGDKISDVETARRVGAKGILVLTGYGRGNYENDRDSWEVKPDYVAEDLHDAVEWILSHLEKRDQ